MSKSTKTVIPAKAGIQKTNGLVPRLRFPEFREAGEWDIAPLKKLASRRTERNRDGKLTRVLTNSAEHGVVDQRDYFDKDIATQGNLENYFIVKKDDFVYNPRISAFAPVGPISRNRVETGVMSPLYTVFEFKGSNTDFYAHYFKSSAWHMYMRQVGSTGARHDRMAISNEDFMAMPLPVPSAEEQKKIADCLSSLDALIAAQADKLDALKNHKKGLMQQLFPREGETVPRLRFPEFRDAGEWVQKPLTKLFDFRDGFAFKSTDFVDSCNEGVIQVVRISDINNQNKNKQKVYVPKSLIDAQGLERYLVDNGDLLLSLTGAAGFNFFFWNGGLSAINQRTCKVVLKNDTHYSLLRLMEPVLYDRLNARGEGQNNNLSKEFLGNTDMLVPTPNEQQKIADCLSSCDALIAAQTEKLEALKTHKKGLMQQLFPCPEAVGV